MFLVFAPSHLGALLAVVDGAAVGEGGLGVGLALEELAAGGGLEVHHRATVRHLLRQPARLWGKGGQITVCSCAIDREKYGHLHWTMMVPVDAIYG